MPAKLSGRPASAELIRSPQGCRTVARDNIRTRMICRGIGFGVFIRAPSLPHEIHPTTPRAITLK
jgi:hypothetical protein